MLIYKCDRCGKVVDSYDRIHRVETREPSIKDIHLCQHCYEGLKLFLGGYKLQLQNDPVPSLVKRILNA